MKRRLIIRKTISFILLLVGLSTLCACTQGDRNSHATPVPSVNNQPLLDLEQPTKSALEIQGAMDTANSPSAPLSNSASNTQPVYAEKTFVQGASFSRFFNRPDTYSYNNSVLAVETQNLYLIDIYGDVSVTYDGGVTFIATPLKFGEEHTRFIFGFYISEPLTVLVYEEFGLTYSILSQNAGKTWEKHLVSQSILMEECSGYFVQFVTETDGWLITESIPLQEEPHGQLRLNRIFTTSDGGKTWKETGNTNDSFARLISGIGFSSMDIGFICFDPCGLKGPIVYWTQDGGKTWEFLESLPSLPEVDDGYVPYDCNIPLSPLFDGANGIMPVSVMADLCQVYYYTSDYGKTWSSTKNND